MRRRFDTLTALSVIILIAIAMMWARSLVRQDLVAFRAPYLWSVESGGGELRLRYERVESHPRSAIRVEFQAEQPNTLRWILNNEHHEKKQLRFLGFGHGTFRRMMAPSEQTPRAPMIPLWRVDIWAVPYWAVFVLAVTLPVRRAWRARIQRGRSRDGQCPRCGYDMRATRERCPECGEQALVPSSAART